MSNKTNSYVRFPIARRIEHLAMMLSFGLLGLTGLPQRFPDSDISLFIVNAFGNIEILRSVHHIAAIVMMFGTGWHLLVAGYKIYVLKEPLSMLPGVKDAIDGFQMILFNLGLRKKMPQMGRYNFEEKLEYWAFVWGAIVMGLTGFMMWNPIMTASILPGEAIPAAKAAHGGEAILAVAAIIIWHMYSVHIKKFNKSMFTGKISEEEMLHEHPLELADLKAGIAGPRITDEKELQKRKKIFFPIATVATILMLAGIYGFANAETTALETVPPGNDSIPAYSPQIPTSTPTPSPTLGANEIPTWDNFVGQVFFSNCTGCHGNDASDADMSSGGLNLASYSDAMKGTSRGPVIIPGNSTNSPLVIAQMEGMHKVNLDNADLQIVIQWIDAGAPEN